MITVRNRYVPTEKATAPPHDRNIPKTADQAHSWLAALLSCGYSLGDVTCTEATISVVAYELGRNTKSLFEYTFSGQPAEMQACLATAYYYLDGSCVEPPADYPFREADTRGQVLERIARVLPKRDAVGEVLKKLGYQPVQLEGMYDLRGCARSWVALMAYAGITDPELLKRGARMEIDKLFDVCAYMRLFGMGFDEALQQVA